MLRSTFVLDQTEEGRAAGLGYPFHSRSGHLSPSPLAGEGRGGGWVERPAWPRAPVPWGRSTPNPDPPPQGGRESDNPDASRPSEFLPPGAHKGEGDQEAAR